LNKEKKFAQTSPRVKVYDTRRKRKEKRRRGTNLTREEPFEMGKEKEKTISRAIRKADSDFRGEKRGRLNVLEERVRSPLPSQEGSMLLREKKRGRGKKLYYLELGRERGKKKSS